jgi:hypothetical protein
MPMEKSMVGDLLVDLEKFDWNDGKEGKHLGSGSNDSTVDDKIFLPFIEALVVDN